MLNKELDHIKFSIDGYYTKKNSQRMVKSKKTGKYFPLPSKRYSDWEKRAVKDALQIKQRYAGKVNFPIKDYKIVLFGFTWWRGVHSDFNNASQGICDVLERAGLFENDRYVLPVPMLPNPFLKQKKRKVSVCIILEDIEDCYWKVLEKDRGK